MKSLVKFSDLKLTEGEMLQLNGGGSGGTGSGGPTPGSGTTTTTPLPNAMPTPTGVTVFIGAPQSPTGAMAMMAGTDVYFGSSSSGAYTGGHEASHTAQDLGNSAYK